MQENVLIKGRLDSKAKNTMVLTILVLLALSVLLLMIGLSVGEAEWVEWLDYYYGRYGYWSLEGERYYNFDEFLKAYKSEYGLLSFYWDIMIDDALVYTIIHWSLLFIAGVVGIILWALSKCQIIITDKNIKGKTFFGKEVVLPLYMVSSYSRRKMFSTIAIATSSGVTKFALVENYQEIGDTLSSLINKRQEATVMLEKEEAKKSEDKFDELKKYKDLLDSGIISQEDFDKKKTEILGL